jgi:hypothetical protein
MRGRKLRDIKQKDIKEISVKQGLNVLHTEEFICTDLHER